MQGERSFDNLFQGFPGADTQNYGYTSTGKRETLHPLTLKTSLGIAHMQSDFFTAFDGGKNDRFDVPFFVCTSNKCPHLVLPQYSFVPPDERQRYTEIAAQYVLADRMFGSTYAGALQVHLRSIAGTDYMTLGSPNQGGTWGCDNLDRYSVLYREPPRKPVFPCFDGPTIADELDAAGVTWRAYVYETSQTGFDAINHIRYGPDFANVILSPEQFLTDVASGQLSGVTWISPPPDASDDSFHAATNGPAWVASLVNAVGQSRFWDSTAVFVTWTNYGGFYDHVPPPQNAEQGHAFRVPLLIVSAYCPRGKVTHEQYQHGSLLKFAEEAFGLDALSGFDGRANSPAREFDFTQPPRAFVPIVQ